MRSFPKQFSFVYLALGLVLAGSAVAVVAILTGALSTNASSWSPWRPASGGVGAGTRAIAHHVESTYRLAETGPALVKVTAQPAPTVSTSSSAVAVDALLLPSRGATTIRTLPTKGMVMYSLCGTGPSCSIATGTPTVIRGRLVRREALELALLTLKYIPTVSSVLAIPPPPRGAPQNYALLFERSTLESELASPLRRTLPLDEPPLPSDPDTTEAS